MTGGRRGGGTATFWFGCGRGFWARGTTTSVWVSTTVVLLPYGPNCVLVTDSLVLPQADTPRMAPNAKCITPPLDKVSDCHTGIVDLKKVIRNAVPVGAMIKSNKQITI